MRDWTTPYEEFPLIARSASLSCPVISRLQMSSSTVISSGCSGLWKAEQTGGDRHRNEALLCERLGRMRRRRRGEVRWPHLHSTLSVHIVGSDLFHFIVALQVNLKSLSWRCHRLQHSGSLLFGERQGFFSFVRV